MSGCGSASHASNSPRAETTAALTAVVPKSSARIISNTPCSAQSLQTPADEGRRVQEAQGARLLYDASVDVYDNFVYAYDSVVYAYDGAVYAYDGFVYAYDGSVCAYDSFVYAYDGSVCAYDGTV
jgi:hypothetical protein